MCRCALYHTQNVLWCMISNSNYSTNNINGVTFRGVTYKSESRECSLFMEAINWKASHSGAPSARIRTRHGLCIYSMT